MPGMAVKVSEQTSLPLLFRETFRDRQSVERGGATLVGSGTTFSDGLVLNGSGNLLYNVSGSKILRATLTIKVEFTLGFAANDGVAHFFYDAYLAAPACRFALWKGADNNLYGLIGGAYIVSSAYAVWSAALIVGKNVLEISTTTGASTAWLNGTQISSRADAWTMASLSALSQFRLGSIYDNTGRFVGTIHSFEIYGAVATAADEPHLRDGSIVSDIDLDKALVWLPGKSYYKRASDNKFVTEVRGKAGITEALMGSDGLTAAQFPSIVRPRGFSFDGGDQINLGDSDQFSFTNGVNDLPFSVAMIVQQSANASASLINKSTTIAAGEWCVYLALQGAGPDHKMVFLLTDNVTAAYSGIVFTNNVRFTGLSRVLVVTHSGSGTPAGMRAYLDSSLVPTSTLASGGYVRMRNTTESVKIGSGVVAQPTGNIVLPTIFDFELSPLQVRALTTRLKRLARVA